MANVGFATLQIIPSAQGFAGKLAGVTAAPMVKSGEEGGKRFGGGMLSGLKGPLLAMGGAFAAVQIGSFLKDATLQAEVAASSIANTNKILEQTGHAAGLSSDGISKLTDSLSLKTGVDHTVIRDGTNILLTFKSIRDEVGKGNDVFSQANALALDMSAVFKTDVKSSATQLGKALEDPIKGITALSRVGVTFTDQEKEKIKTLVESGHKLEAQKIVLAALSSQVGGTAEASSNSSDKIANAFGLIKEKIGSVLLPYMDKAAAWMQQNLLPLIDQIGPTFKKVVDAIGPVVSTVFGVIAKIGGFIVDNLPAFQTLAVVILSVVSAIKIWTAVQTILNVVLTANPIGILVVAIAALVAGIVYAWNNFEGFRNVVTTVWEAIKTAFTAAVTFLTGLWQTFTGWLSSTWDGIVSRATGAWTQIQSEIAAVWDAITGAISTAVGFVQNVISTAWDAIKTVATTVWNAIKGVIEKVWAAIVLVVTTYVNAWRTVVTTVWNAIKTVATTVWNAIKAVVTRVFSAIVAAVTTYVNVWKTVVTTAWNTIKTVASTVWNAIKTVVSTVFNAIVGIVKADVGLVLKAIDGIKAIIAKVAGFFGQMKQAIITKAGEAIAWLRGLGGRVLSAVGNLGSILVDAGRRIIEGFLRGLKSAFEGVKSFVGGIGSWIADHKGPKAYDLRLLVPAGGYIMQGLAAGLERGRADVRDALGRTVADIQGTTFGSPAFASPSLAGAGAGRAAVVVNNYNPVAEPSSVTTTKTLTRLAFLGV